MAGQIHHVAVNSPNFEETVHFFQALFDMEVSRTRGEAPERKLWFRQGIQVNEVPAGNSLSGRYDHIGILVEDKEEILEKAFALGCTAIPGKPHWFTTPDGIVIELMA